MRKYDKPALTNSEHISLLQSRGLVVNHKQEAETFLNFVSYYHIRAYLVPFEKPGETEHIFQDNIKFEDVQTLYAFDRELRLLMLDAIKLIENALRAQWANLMAKTYGPHGYLDMEFYKDSVIHVKNLSNLGSAYTNSKEDFAVHYKNNYHDPNLPPVWLATELMSLGLLSRFIKNLKNDCVKKMARTFTTDKRVLTSFIHHLSIVRNVCAHHGRLWNKSFHVKFTLPRKPDELADAISRNCHGRLYNTIVMINYLLAIIAPENDWKEKVVDLIKSNAQVNPGNMGFPDNWQDLMT